MKFSNTRFETSAARLSQSPQDTGAEVAFAGRSNAGKSSAINSLTGIKKLARTSKTPGRTQLINYFLWQEGLRLVDLPGYGFAKVPEPIKRAWHRLMEDYFSRRRSLRGLVLVMDIRHPLKDTDWQMLDWCRQSRLPVHVLLTKCDKLTRGKAASQVLLVQRQLREHSMPATVQAFSSLKKTGLEELESVVAGWLQA